MDKKKIAVLIGSLRKESYNRKMAKEMMALPSERIDLEIVDIADLPHYNEDLETEHPPKSWTAFREKIKGADGYLFFTPEYNRGMPSALKNAIDIASRPYGHNCWAAKPGGVVSVSISALGAFGANHHLRQSMVFVDVLLMQQPEAYIGNAAALFERGTLVQDTKDFLEKYLRAFEEWVAKF